MQITPEHHGDLIELHVAGRLDAEWAATLWQAIDDALRQGFHSLLVDLSGVTYASSAGLSVLVRARQQFQEIRGFFGVGGAQGSVEEVIRLTGLAKLLLCDLEAVRRASPAGRGTIQLPAQIYATADVDVEVYDLDRTARIECELFGDPKRFGSETYSSADASEVAFGEDAFALGLGAFGATFQDCAPRFGELLAAAGAVVQLPAGGAGIPDFQVASGEFVPKAQMLYGLKWTGAYSQLLRFESDDPHRRVSLNWLIEQSLSRAGTSAAATVIVAETSGLVGAALRQSPASPVSESHQSRFDHPEVRDWLIFTPEHAFPHTLAVIVGVAARSPVDTAIAPLAPFLRPLSQKGGILGHFHAAVFPFRPFKKRKLELAETVRSLFESEQLQGLLHLIHDERAISGSGESEFHRGACWIGPIGSVREGQR